MKLSALTKFIDQPLIVHKISKASPYILAGTALGIGINDVLSKKPSHDSKKDKIIKNIFVLSTVASASLLAAKGLKIGNKKIFNGLISSKTKTEILKAQEHSINSYLEKSKIKDKTLINILNKAKKTALNPKDISLVLNKTKGKENSSELYNGLFGSNKNLTSKEIFSEIGKLSLLGLVPVVSGVTAGNIIDKSPNKKINNSNRIKEGFYQYFANIFLCNVGAGLSLFTLEAMKKKNLIKKITPMKKFGAMITGIATTGVIGGSFIANYMSKKIIDPLVLKKKREKLSFNKIYEERKPEGLDIAMHADDIATAGVLSGLKWIEPMLPVFYMFSGYRAGMGYRNNGNKH